MKIDLKTIADNRDVTLDDQGIMLTDSGTMYDKPPVRRLSFSPTAQMMCKRP